MVVVASGCIDRKIFLGRFAYGCVQRTFYSTGYSKDLLAESESDLNSGQGVPCRKACPDLGFRLQRAAGELISCGCSC